MKRSHNQVKQPFSGQLFCVLIGDKTGVTNRDAAVQLFARTLAR